MCRHNNIARNGDSLPIHTNPSLFNQLIKRGGWIKPIQARRLRDNLCGNRYPCACTIGAWGGGETALRRLLRTFLNSVRRLNPRSEEHTSELQSLMRISYAVFCLKKNKT